MSRMTDGMLYNLVAIALLLLAFDAIHSCIHKHDPDLCMDLKDDIKTIGNHQMAMEHLLQAKKNVVCLPEVKD